MCAAIGTFDKKSGGVVVNFGKIVKIGDTIWVRRLDTHDPSEEIVESITQWHETNVFTGESLETICVINAKWGGVLTPVYCIDFINPATVYANKPDALKAKINNDHYVGVGDFVWLWRWVGQYPALVRKRVCAVKRSYAWEDRYQPVAVQCTYLDNYWPRKENPNTLFISEAEALAARPDWAKVLEAALIRAGRTQGERKAA